MTQNNIDGLAITISGPAGWNEYVLKHPRSFFYHLYGWGGILEQEFRFKKIYLAAKKQDKICGILPLLLTRGLLSKNLISIPIGVCAGVLSDDEETEQRLISRAIELTKELGCDYLELRNIKKIMPDLPSKELYAIFIKELPKDPQECLQGLPRKARSAARHAIDSGLTYDTGLKYLNDCYEIYAVNQKFLGSPVVSRGWFERLAQAFGDKTDVLVVKMRGKCISAVLTFFYKDTILPFYGGSIFEYESYYPNNFMYLKLQEYGVMKGYRYFDFGRSRTGSGSYSFKINQGFEPAQLYYQYYLNKAKVVPRVDPSNELFNAARWAWKKMPLSLTKWLGPKIFKYVIP